MDADIRHADHTGLVAVTRDTAHEWTVRISSAAGSRPDPLTIAAAVSEAVSLIQLDASVSPGPGESSRETERATSTFDRFLASASHIDFHESAARLARLRDERLDTGTPPADLPETAVVVGPVTVRARQGFVVSVEIDTSGSDAEVHQMERACGAALTQATRDSITASERAHDHRLHAHILDALVYREHGGTP